MLNSVTLRLIKIGNSKGFCIPSKILNKLGSGETIEMSLDKETKTLLIKPVESLTDQWIRKFHEAGDDGIVERAPYFMPTGSLKEDM